MQKRKLLFKYNTILEKQSFTLLCKSILKVTRKTNTKRNPGRVPIPGYIATHRTYTNLQ